MKTVLKSKKIFTPDGFVDGYLTINNGVIESIDTSSSETDVMDVGDKMVLPGIIDVHNHGFGGWSVTDDIDEDVVRGYAKSLTTIGITSVLPTAKEEAFEAIANVMDEDYVGAKMPGIHSEGPFWARGGENSVNENYPAPDVDETKRLIDVAKGKMVYMAIAPEVPGAYDVIRYLNSQNILVAACHTRAMSEDVFKAMKEVKIDAVTHLGNGMQGIHHRNAGSLGSFLLSDGLYYEIITDLNHLCKEMIQIMLKLQPYQKFMLISDSNYMAGMPVGRYMRYGREMRMTEEGLIKDTNGRICGSGKYVLYNMKMMVNEVGVPFDQVVEMASLIPARFLSIDDKTGSLEVGKQADIMVIDDDYNCKYTFVDGKLAFDASKDKLEINPEAYKNKLD